jgi:penicillin V acylase-like amidase (Ntn superfamily)
VRCRNSVVARLPRLLGVCTRVFWSSNGVAKVVSRTMDWRVSDQPDLWFVPAGTVREGHAGRGPHSWTSRFSSTVLSMWRAGTVDGMNSQGLGAHGLYLDDAEYEPRDSRPGVASALWVQYVLDCFATVEEVVHALPDVQIVSVPIKGQQMGGHLAIDDASGDSAIIEPIGGTMVVHHGREHTVMANDPSFDEQLANLTRYRPFGGDLPPPGDITSLDRFVRMRYFLHYLPEPEDQYQAVAGVFHLASNASVPYGAPYDDDDVYPTWWIAAADLTNLTYYFWSTLSPTALWVSIPDLATHDTVGSLNPRDPKLSGDVSSVMTSTALPY